LIAQDKLSAAAHFSPPGPIEPLDILYAHRLAMAQANLSVAHRYGFTQEAL
jgi:hypothetical protein